MCLALVAIEAHARFRFVIAANRDEYYGRPAAPAAWGNAAPFVGILAGRDLAAGGTWLGVTASGRFAFLTNVREPQRYAPSAPSRGEIVPRVLAARDPAKELHRIAADGGGYNGFNLLYGDAGGASWVSNRAASPLPVETGIHGLSNALLDTPWPKLSRTKAAFEEWASRAETDIQPLFAILADRAVAPNSLLPETGIGLERERALSAPFVIGESYGTRCSTVVTIEYEGQAQVIERTFDPGGALMSEVAFAFALADCALAH